jgi:hypothetical protein
MEATRETHTILARVETVERVRRRVRLERGMSRIRGVNEAYTLIGRAKRNLAEILRNGSSSADNRTPPDRL